MVKFEELKALGITANGDTTYERGYTSRKGWTGDKSNCKVYVAGGNRKGQLYIKTPCYRSTYYGTLRVYLTIDERRGWGYPYSMAKDIDLPADLYNRL